MKMGGCVLWQQSGRRAGDWGGDDVIVAVRGAWGRGMGGWRWWRVSHEVGKVDYAGRGMTDNNERFRLMFWAGTLPVHGLESQSGDY